jgi:hypothetical protein
VWNYTEPKFFCIAFSCKKKIIFLRSSKVCIMGSYVIPGSFLMSSILLEKGLGMYKSHSQVNHTFLLELELVFNGRDFIWLSREVARVYQAI